MVRIRKGRSLRLLPGTNILLPTSAFVDDQTLLPEYSQYSKYLLPINSDETKQIETNQPEKNTEVKEEQNNSKVEDSPDQVSPLKRRKRHKRKNVPNQELCLMRGVYFKNMKWQAAIKVDKKQIHLGTVGSQEEAARLYDRAAFKCGREPNFELGEDEKKELGKYSWDEFLAMTRRAITHKKGRRRVGAGFSKKSEGSLMENDDSEEIDLSGSEDAEQEFSDS